MAELDHKFRFILSMREQTPQEIRNSLMMAIYKSKNRYSFDPQQEFKYQKMLMDNTRFENEVRYLVEEEYLKKQHQTLDGYYELAITSKGIKYVEKYMDKDNHTKNTKSDSARTPSATVNEYKYGDIINSSIFNNVAQASSKISTTKASFMDTVVSYIIKLFKKIFTRRG